MRFSTLVFTLILLCSISLTSNAKDNIQKSGDILQIALPLIGLGSTYFVENNHDGSIAFLKALTTSAISTLALKTLTHERRPNGECCDSFPSGHTSVAFMTASFIHLRYGIKYAIPAYLTATFVGYSRVHANVHYKRDVIAGAVVGILSSYLFTKKYDAVTISPYVDHNSVGMQFSGSF